MTAGYPHHNLLDQCQKRIDPEIEIQTGDMLGIKQMVRSIVVSKDDALYFDVLQLLNIWKNQAKELEKWRFQTINPSDNY